MLRRASTDSSGIFRDRRRGKRLAVLGQSVRKRQIDEGLLVVGAFITFSLIILAVAVIVFSGLAERLVASGLNDLSSQSRLLIYGIFGYMSPDQLLFGMPRLLAEYIITNNLNLPRSESSLVDYVIEFGFVGTTIIVSALVYFYWQLVKGSQQLVRHAGRGCVHRGRSFQQHVFLQRGALRAHCGTLHGGAGSP